MTELPWAIARYNEPGFDEWYIYDVKTDMAICDSPVRATLETVLELLAVCIAVQPKLYGLLCESWGHPDNWPRPDREGATVYARLKAVIAKAKQDD